MKMNNRKHILLGMIILGTTISILNVIPAVDASPGLFGTTTYVEMHSQEWYFLVGAYGDELMSKRYFGDDQYCVYNESNCCIVM